MTTLHTLYDGSILKSMSAKELLSIPIWKGNRILDTAHASKIKAAIGSEIQKLDSGYRIVKYREPATDGRLVEQAYIIDGQHRLSVLRDFFNETVCSPDFKVVVVEKEVSCELDAIQYFNEINTVKPQCWTADPNLITNLYIAALEKKFNVKRTQLIRKGAAHRPYLSSDKLREKIQNFSNLKFDSASINRFAEKALVYNTKQKTQSEIEMALQADTKDYMKKAVALGFFLALDPKLKWVDELLRED